MTVSTYISNQLKARIDRHECLVVYDCRGLYRELALNLAGEKCMVVDGSRSTIISLEEAQREWARVGQASRGERQLLIYLPTAKPGSDEEKQRDPFQRFALGGAVFPDTDADSYLELCLAAKPDHEEQIRALFASDEHPPFDTIDALDSGTTWPKLRSLLGVESKREILIALLSPTETQRTALEEDTAWQAEYARFVRDVLGWRPDQKLKKWSAIRAELARFILFSEFVFDLGDDLPKSLERVARADANREDLVRSVCHALRTSQLHQEDYIRLANTASSELDLEKRCTDVKDFGRLDTFEFEERFFLRKFAERATRGDLGEASQIVDERRSSIWAHSDDRGTAWLIAERGLELVQLAGALEGEVASRCKTLVDCVDFYVKEARRVDALHRGFEQTVREAYGMTDELDAFIEQVRLRYRAFIDKLQKCFMKRVTEEGWPISGRLRQTQVFDTYVAPILEQHGRKVAYIMVDAFRYELAAEFASKLTGIGEVELHPTAAYLPTITPVGMAALLPGADGKLRLRKHGDTLVPSIDGHKISVPKERLEYTKTRFGDRCAMLDLDDLFNKRKRKLDDSVQLLLVKTTEIDTAGEAEASVRRVIQEVQEKFLRSIKILQDMGFERVVFATDHGFILLGEQAPGDKVDRPSGTWLLEKDRCVLGSGSAGKGSRSFAKEEVGIQGDFDQFVVAETLGAYRTGSTYMHAGMSLQECILPVLVVDSTATREPDAPGIDLRIQYRGGTTDRITSRRPVIEITLFQEDIFGDDTVEFQLEIQTKKRTVGEAAQNSYMDPATKLIEIKAGTAIKVPLRMAEDYEGAFTVAAVNPVTQVTYASIELRTDYVD